MHAVMEGALRYYVDTSTTTYKLNGAWGNTQNPGIGSLDGATSVFDRPTIVTDALATELRTYGVGTVTTV